MDIKSFRDLIVWQKAYTLAIQVYQISKNFPNEEMYGLTSQIRRSAVSIPSNIAEGYGRRRSGEYERFLSIGMGSLYELQTQLNIARDLGYSSSKELSGLLDLCNEVERMLNTLITRILSK